jgi:hypothetical protein
MLADDVQAVAAENAFFTLAVLREKGDKRPLTWIVVDAHLRHDVRLATRCALRLREKVASWLKKYPGAEVLVGGDLNHDRLTPVYAALTTGKAADGFRPPVAGDQSGLELKDAFDYSGKPAGQKWGTYHPFNGVPLTEYPSDLLLYAGNGLAPAGGGFSQILREQSPEHRYASDHFFVIATFDAPHP